MKRTWVVYIDHGPGHELNNCITEAEWFGPYTREEAERLAEALNKVFRFYEDDESLGATAMSLESISPKKVYSRYYQQWLDQIDT